MPGSEQANKAIDASADEHKPTTQATSSRAGFVKNKSQLDVIEAYTQDLIVKTSEHVQSKTKKPLELKPFKFEIYAGCAKNDALFAFYYTVLQLHTIARENQVEKHVTGDSQTITDKAYKSSSALEHKCLTSQKTHKIKKKLAKPLPALSLDKRLRIHQKLDDSLAKNLNDILHYPDLTIAFWQDAISRRTWIHLLHGLLLDGDHLDFFRQIKNTWLKAPLRYKSLLPPLVSSDN